MDFNKAFFLKKESQKPRWVVVDATDQVLGRLATRVADMLRGKDKPIFTPHADAGDYVVIVNAQKVKLTGKKWDQKIYDKYTGWMGGYKVSTARQLQARHPDQIIELAVKRMLPKNKLSRQLIKKLRVYQTADHPHQAQVQTLAAKK